MTDKIVLVTTCESAAEAERIASTLVDSRLAACVNILPGVTSVYRWKGSVERASEIVLLIKTSRPLLRSVQAEVERLHSYELPEVIALQIVDGSERYIEWLSQGLASDAG
jgi:periplasmic divalent cation tolerance protein